MSISILYGLASRSNKYGLRGSKSQGRFLLSEIIKIGISEFDSALMYDVSDDDYQDIGRSGATVSTKLMIPADIEDKRRIEHHMDLLARDMRGYCYYHGDLSCKKTEDKIKEFSRLAEEYGCRPSYSVYTSDDIKKILELGCDIEAVQLPVNPATYIDTGLVSKLKARGCSLVARSVFLQGAFFSPESMVGAERMVFEEAQKILISIGSELQMTLEELLLRYSYEECRNSGIDKVILSTTDLERLKRQIAILRDGRGVDVDYIRSRVEFAREFSNPRRWKQKE